MEKEMIVYATGKAVEIALMENGKLTEIHKQKATDNFTVGDVFWGKIKRINAPLNAAFVDIGHKKDAFLHYTDLGPKVRTLQKWASLASNGRLKAKGIDNFRPEKEIVKTGRIDQVFERRQNVLAQVLKEPISTKGPRLSCEITLPGRFLVITPFSDAVAVSKKISTSEERKRLKLIIDSIKPKNFGVIVRTAAEGRNTAELLEEVNKLVGKWDTIKEQLKTGKPPIKLLSEIDKTSSLLRDLLTDNFNRIVIDDRELFEKVKAYLQKIAPDKVKLLQLHKSNRPIFDVCGVTKQIKSSFGKTATMASGAYIVIEHTEAMHVIDVNSGNKMPSKDQAEAVLKINMEAAEEIARQMRLRDIGGIIIVDFIDMRDGDHRKKLVTAMRKFMKKDRAQHTVLPLTKFGLMQITRQRVRPEVKITTDEKCPSCNGTGKINASILLTDEIDRDLNLIMEAQPKAKLKLRLHPYAAAFLKKGIPNQQMKWYMKYYSWLKIIPDADYPITTYKFFDKNDDEVRLEA
ncbi:MAG: Rne/Rng family ribonuclease [Bacteroidota bacterium]